MAHVEVVCDRVGKCLKNATADVRVVVLECAREEVVKHLGVSLRLASLLSAYIQQEANAQADVHDREKTSYCG